MPIIRNPFRKNDENARPSLTVNSAEKPPGSSNGSKQSLEGSEKSPVEYKLSGKSLRHRDTPAPTMR